MVEEPWVEKYRPSSLEELVLDKKNKIFMNSYVRNFESAPHLLLVSKSPGTGKTSLVYVIGKVLDLEVLRLNASDERGIQTIREKVKKFIMTVSLTGKKKLCFLDEADYLTDEAQTSLRAMMEEYTYNAKFILACNYLHKIIEPIVSRCVVLDFSFPPKEQIEKYLLKILEQEKVKYKNEVLQQIIERFYPSIRDMVQELQRQFLIYGEVSHVVEDVKGVARAIAEELLRNSNPFKLRGFWLNKVMDYESLLLDFIDCMESKLDGKLKMKLYLLGAKYNYRQKIGAHPELQWMAFLVELYEELQRQKEILAR